MSLQNLRNIVTNFGSGAIPLGLVIGELAGVIENILVGVDKLVDAVQRLDDTADLPEKSGALAEIKKAAGDAADGASETILNSPAPADAIQNLADAVETSAKGLQAAMDVLAQFKKQ